MSSSKKILFVFASFLLVSQGETNVCLSCISLSILQEICLLKHNLFKAVKRKNALLPTRSQNILNPAAVALYSSLEGTRCAPSPLFPSGDQVRVTVALLVSIWFWKVERCDFRENVIRTYLKDLLQLTNKLGNHQDVQAWTKHFEELGLHEQFEWTVEQEWEERSQPDQHLAGKAP